MATDSNEAALGLTISSGRVPASRGALAELWRRLSGDPAALCGGAIVLGAILIAVIGPQLAPHDPLAQNTGVRLSSPGTAGYLLGADQLGRDILSRLLYGARPSLMVGIAPLIAAVLLGLLLGVPAGYYGGALDMILGRLFDVLLAFPAILLAIAIVAALGPGLPHAMIALVIVVIPSYSRVARASVLSLRHLDYVGAARACGASDFRIIWSHILPNCLAPIVVYASLGLGLMIIFGAGLSFLGLGPQPPTPEWGAMLAQARDVMAVAPHVATIPGLAIFAVALGANLLGDGLRDALDPRLRNR